ncbi:hypothetical protein BGZ57DRAFT_963113 [Hyaloscypha finlandica]|nr:hypothetical protein BGZ57DRAFT_963113 [Hyaloscypha finlandica]
MPPIQIELFQIPDKTKEKPVPDMVEATFGALATWFEVIVGQIQREWLNGVTDGDDEQQRVNVMDELGLLVGKANGLKDNLQDSLTRLFSIVPPLSLSKMNLPRKSTIEKDLGARAMVKKTFSALRRWFTDTIVPDLKSAWTKATVGKKINSNETWRNLSGLEGVINTKRITLQRFVNELIAVKERGRGASAGGHDEVDVSGKARLQLLRKYLDIQFDDNDEVDEVDEV